MSMESRSCNYTILVFIDKNNLELDVDIAGDLAALKENLAKFKKGKMKGLEDIDINELDWVYTVYYYYVAEVNQTRVR